MSFRPVLAHGFASIMRGIAKEVVVVVVKLELKAAVVCSLFLSFFL
ncbi:hypothetical protein MOQ_001308, partial [Trypanosoma cruzi marinkellei]